MSMVQVSGKTYRIVDLGAGDYDAIRLLDDVRMGSFGGTTPLRVDAVMDSDLLLRQIATVAIRTARTHWAPLRAQS